MGPLRTLVLPTREALPWRWELAQLELGCRAAWPQPGAHAWAARAARLARRFADAPGKVALAFEGYTLVGAVWTLGERRWDVRGPFVMPQFRASDLDSRLRALLNGVRDTYGVRNCL